MKHYTSSGISLSVSTQHGHGSHQCGTCKEWKAAARDFGVRLLNDRSRKFSRLVGWIVHVRASCPSPVHHSWPKRVIQLLSLCAVQPYTISKLFHVLMNPYPSVSCHIGNASDDCADGIQKKSRSNNYFIPQWTFLRRNPGVMLLYNRSFVLEGPSSWCRLGSKLQDFHSPTVERNNIQKLVNLPCLLTHEWPMKLCLAMGALVL